MKYILFLVALCFSISASAQIIPEPLKMTKGTGQFVLNAKTKFVVDAEAKKAAKFFTDYLKSRKLSDGVVNQVIITTRGADTLPAEGYTLSVTPGVITVTGKGAGLFYGIQSLLQLFTYDKKEPASVPCVNLLDAPRFGYRGLMLDVSRHFFTVAQVKELLDLMAYYKLNRFHWHLTDDQGWRLEIKSYPKLTSVGAWRVPRVGDFGGNMEAPKPGEAATDGGFYTQAQIKEIVQYAADRHIQIMPEIDVPGHSMAIVSAYPELSVTKNANTRVNPGSSFAKWFPDGHFEMYEDNTLNPTDENVYEFLDAVFSEVAALFPYEYIHIGGDECFKGYWKKDSSVQTFMRANNIADEHQLQRYFINRVNTIIKSKHRKLIGWDEILDGDLNNAVAIMNRFGDKRIKKQAEKGLNIITTPAAYSLYFDYAQSNSELETINHGGNCPWWKAYSFDPAYPDSLTAQQSAQILGVQACIWTEHIPSVSKLQYMTFPRLLALANTGWTSQANKSVERFRKETLPVHLARFDANGVNYWVPPVFTTIDTTIKTANYRFDIHPPFPGARIYYTLSNRHPGDADHEYKGAINITIPSGKKITLKTIVITPAGRRSVVTRTILDNAGG